MRFLPFFRQCRAVGLAGPLLSAATLATAQTVSDSTRLSYGEEVQTAPAAVPARVQADERSILKLGLNNFTFQSSSPDISTSSFYTRYGVHLAYERKLGSPAWSVLGELSPAVARFRPVANGELRSALALRTQVAGRYYYNLARRLRLGRSAGSFSANYFTAAVGAGVGRQARESALYQIAPNGRLLHPDAALAYGLQRRLGRHGFIDANAGISTLFEPNYGYFSVEPHFSLRVGLVLGDAPAATVASLRPVVDADDAQRPKAYVGVQLGSYNYQLHHSDINPYPSFRSSGRAGYGSYSREIKSPYYEVGYYLRPRLAVQVGVQEQNFESTNSVSFNGVLVSAATTREQELAVPVLLRFTLTRPFLRRVQFDALGGLAVVRSVVRYQQFGGQPASFDFERKATNVYAVLGLDAAYGIGRRRRVQAVVDLMFTKSLGSNPSAAKTVELGSGIGLRYRFGY